jgi:uncharacterized protein (DUF488 family)
MGEEPTPPTPPTPRYRVYTLGHSAHPLSRFLELLRQHGVTLVVDVRSRPYSRWAPQYQRAALERELARAGLGYAYLGRELGGRPEGVEFQTPLGRLDVPRRAQSPEFLAGVARLLALARGGGTALLCAEEDPARCHRRSLVTPALQRRAAEVWHIRGNGRLQSDAELDAAIVAADPQGRLFDT